MSEETKTNQPSKQNPAGLDHPHAKRHAIFALIGVIVIVAFGAWRWFKKEVPLTPYEELRLLESASRPVTETADQRLKELIELQKNSGSVVTSPEERIRELESMSR